MNKHVFWAAASLAALSLGVAFGGGDDRIDNFRQLEEVLPTANTYRTASGAPGHEYWQQQVDYIIDVRLLEDRHRIVATETITYQNNSPDTLRYLWLQLDQNRFRTDSHSVRTSLGPNPERDVSFANARRLMGEANFEGGMNVSNIQTAKGVELSHTINDTMMRIDLATPLAPGTAVTFSLDWEHNINNHEKSGGRGGYEHFERDDNDIFEMAQWFPRLCAYTDVNGWQNKQFLGRGEFTLEFGDYDVSITVPADHIVASTGVLQNPEEVLNEDQIARLETARTNDVPMFIVTPEEATRNENQDAKTERTWTFHADYVRDFAWASSRKFIWDAQGIEVDDRTVMAMSYYPNEGEPLWSQYSTHAILHTIDVFGKHTFAYPYPVAISVNGPVGGMEYPMICFNGPRPEEDGTYSARTKYGLISVVIHEVGHNWFPMIVNSDERQWTWMDEGLNSFVQYLAEQEWEEDYPSWRGDAANITGYMKDERQVPIMTNSESLLQFGSNAYAKPATALNILRETVMGRELFDFAFKEYSNRWKFKRPEPSDLFRTMEDASAVDLDWFFRGWFYTTDHVDLSLDNVTHYTINTLDPEIENGLAKAKRDEKPDPITKERNVGIARRMQAFPELADFYNAYDKLDVLEKDRERFNRAVGKLSAEDKATLQSKFNFYSIELSMVGDLVTPVLLQLNFVDGTSEELRIPAEVWIKGERELQKLVACEKELANVTLDHRQETADVDTSNNVFPRPIGEERLKLRGEHEGNGSNPMRDAAKAKEDAENKAKKDAEEVEPEPKKKRRRRKPL